MSAREALSLKEWAADAVPLLAKAEVLHTPAIIDKLAQVAQDIRALAPADAVLDAQEWLDELQGEYRELSGFSKAKRARWYGDDSAYFLAQQRVGSAIKQAQAALYLAQGKAGIEYIDMTGCDTKGD